MRERGLYACSETFVRRSIFEELSVGKASNLRATLQSVPRARPVTGYCDSSPIQRQIEQQVLRLQLQFTLRVHRHRQINRLSGDIGAHIRWIFETQFKQAKQAAHAFVFNRVVVVKIIQDAAGRDVEPNVPHPLLVINFTPVHDGHVYAQKMRDSSAATE